MNQAIDGYTLTDTLYLDEEFVLTRGVRSSDCTPVLLRVARQAGLAERAALEREFLLRGELDGDWAAVPHTLLADARSRYAALVLDDPGSMPLPLVPGQALPLDEFLRIGAAIAQSLARMHRRLIAHQGLKPGHLLIDPRSGCVQMTGFGAARRIGDAQDTCADLYSVGVILHQMLTGALPFAVSGAHGGWGAPPACPAAPPVWRGIDPTCQAIVQKLLATSAEQRYQSAAGLHADLRQCATSLAAHGSIAPFALGCQDGAARVRVPQQLVGRDSQLALLEAALHEARSMAAPELLLVSGAAGTGKSALMAALRQRAQATGATIIDGKFDERQRDIPYATLAQAFQGMVRRRLAADEATLSAWRMRLMAALGRNARLMLELIPELKFVIGEHAAPPPLAPAEAQCRFESVFRKFVAACCAPDSVLLLCLDDLQWIDLASLNLLTHLLTHPGVRHVVVVGAYRASAVSAEHPAALAWARMREQGTRLREMNLLALDRQDAAALVAASLGSESAPVAALAALVYPKTAGNPFFTLQFLMRIAEGGLLHFDTAAERWDWNTAAIAAQAFSENVVELMVARLQQLPPSTLDLVRLLACLGPQAGMTDICQVAGMTVPETDECLWPATRMGLVLRDSEGYRFLHDRVREGAYALIEPGSLAERHLHIGRLLLSHSAAVDIDKQLFAIVHHLNRALPAIADPGELRRLARLNTRAGAKASNAIAYDSARDYYSLAAGLTPARAWQDDFESVFALYLALAECEYLCGHLERSGRLFALLTEQARTRVELARVALMRIALYQVSGRFDLAAATALEALAMFGVTFPEEAPAIAPALAAEQLAIASNMAGRSIASLLDEPASSDPEVAAVCELLADMGSSVFSARPELYPLLAAKALNFTLRYGSTETSCMTYSRYAIFLVSLGHMRDAFAYSDLALNMVQRELRKSAPAPRRSGRLRFVHGAYIHSWREPISGSVIQLEQAYHACLEGGDLPHAGYAAHIATWNRFEAGAPLAEVVGAARTYQAFARQQRNEPLLQLLRCYEQLARCLQGLTREEGSFDDAGFNAASAFGAFEQASFGAAIARFHLMRQVAAFQFGHYREALAAAEAAAQTRHFFLASLNEATHYFYHALTLAALYRATPREQQPAAMRTLRAHQEKLRAWAAWCPNNFDNRYLLVTAELARLRGRPGAAMLAYDQAIASATAAGFVHNQALACELAAAFCTERGTDALPYAQRALAGWREWGADGKVRQLLSRYPALVSVAPAPSYLAHS